MAQTKTSKKPSKETEGKSGRAASEPNTSGYACPECWAVPETIRNDGISTARHAPATQEARLFRDTEYCNGQGRQGRFVIDKAWKPGKAPQHAISAREHQEHGTAKFEARQAAAAEKAERTSNASKNAKSPKATGKKPAKKSAPKRKTSKAAKAS